jgi:hypothetical protein
VLLEYGYALKVLSHTFLIPIMNTAFGPPEKLPFDMGHRRHPLTYDFAPAATGKGAWRAKVTALAAELEAMLRPTITLARSRPDKNPNFEKRMSTISPAFFFPRGSKIASFGNRGEQQYVYEGEKAIYVRVSPKFADNQTKVGRARIKELFDQRAVVPFSITRGGITSRNDYGWIILCPYEASNCTTRGITQCFPSGEIWGVNSEVFVQTEIGTVIGFRQLSSVLPMIDVEKLFVRALADYIRFAINDLKLGLPLVIEFGAVGLKDVYLTTAPTIAYQRNFHGPINEDILVRKYDITDATPNAILSILRTFLDELYDHAECVRSKVLTNDLVRVNGLPPLTPI